LAPPKSCPRLTSCARMKRFPPAPARALMALPAALVNVPPAVMDKVASAAASVDVRLIDPLLVKLPAVSAAAPKALEPCMRMTEDVEVLRAPLMLTLPITVSDPSFTSGAFHVLLASVS